MSHCSCCYGHCVSLSLWAPSFHSKLPIFIPNSAHLAIMHSLQGPTPIHKYLFGQLVTHVWCYPNNRCARRTYIHTYIYVYCTLPRVTAHFSGHISIWITQYCLQQMLPHLCHLHIYRAHETSKHLWQRETSLWRITPQTLVRRSVHARSMHTYIHMHARTCVLTHTGGEGRVYTHGTSLANTT